MEDDDLTALDAAATLAAAEERTRARRAGDVQDLLHRPDLVNRIEEQGGVIEGEGPAEFRARIPREIAVNIEVARAANIRIE